MKFKSLILFVLFIGSTTVYAQNPFQRHRVVISSDIGGSDPDDYQSMIHYLLYSDLFDTEGIISSPPHEGRVKHILEVIDCYEKDYPKLSSYSAAYPAPEYLRSISVQGAKKPQKNNVPDKNISEGAQHLIDCAMKNDSRPLYVLVWGSITDIAQALAARPEIKNKIRVYFIGSWNTRQDSLARNYVYNQHPDLWWIENNTTFRGMYMGGFQQDQYSNLYFVENHVKEHGALGELFYQKKKDIKMGDTPSMLYLLTGNPADPQDESWGGSFIQTGHGKHYWTDNPDKKLIENGKAGAKTVNKWRKQYLNDWKKRMDRAAFFCKQNCPEYPELED